MADAFCKITFPGIVITARRMRGGVFTISDKEYRKAKRFRAQYPGWEFEPILRRKQMSRVQWVLVAFARDKSEWLSWRNG